MYLREATWEDYRHVLRMRGERSVPRVAFLDGTIEIMTPSRPHESIKGLIGRLVEVWCLEHGIEFSTFGSWTLENEGEKGAAEPDECYYFGESDNPERPDLAIEVVWSSGGIDKLEIYRRLGVREVWYWRRGVIQPYVLGGDGFRAVERSEALRALDLVQLASFLDRPRTSQAIREYRDALRAR